jgi:hypothetical protein
VNAGYVAGWLLVSAAILFATGWRRQLTDEIPLAGTLIYLLGLLVFLNLSQAHPLYLYWTGGVIVLFLYRISPRMKRLYVLMAAAFVGALWIWFRKLYAVDPIIVLWHPYWDGPIIIGFVAAVLAVGFREQFVIVSGSMLVAEWTTGGAASPWEWLDAWLLALAASRLGAGAWNGIGLLTAHGRNAICRNRPK